MSDVRVEMPLQFFFVPACAPLFDARAPVSQRLVKGAFKDPTLLKSEVA